MTLPRVTARCGAVALAGLLVAGLAGCGATAGSGGAPASGLAVATAPPPDTSDPDEDDPDDVPGAHGPVSAGSAAEDDITEALTAAGVGDPEKWAKEVVAHRPYPAADPKLATLRTALAQDGADPATAAKIVSVLKP